MIVQLREPVTEKADNYAYACEPEKPYFVYAILSDDSGNDQSYMINVWGKNANNTIYEIPSHYFKVIDSSIPENWEEGNYEAYGKGVKINSFPEMARNKLFYDDLMSDQTKAVDTFKQYQEVYEETAKKALD